MTSTNRHPRDVSHSAVSNHHSFGWVVDLVDPDADHENVAPGEDVDIHIRPASNGYKIYVRWTAPDGERKHNSTHVSLVDPRDEIAERAEDLGV